LYKCRLILLGLWVQSAKPMAYLYVCSVILAARLVIVELWSQPIHAFAFYSALIHYYTRKLKVSQLRSWLTTVHLSSSYLITLNFITRLFSLVFLFCCVSVSPHRWKSQFGSLTVHSFRSGSWFPRPHSLETDLMPAFFCREVFGPRSWPSAA